MKTIIDSPCVRNCCLDVGDICLGCGRSLGEITGWYQAPNEEKVRIIETASARLRERKNINLW